MPLTPQEIAFMGPTTEEYVIQGLGPAWAVLRERGIWYRDLNWLMEAYKIVDPPRSFTISTPDGGTEQILEFGRTPEQLPECPWPDPETVRRRARSVAERSTCARGDAT